MKQKTQHGKQGGARDVLVSASIFNATTSCVLIPVKTPKSAISAHSRLNFGTKCDQDFAARNFQREKSLCHKNFARALSQHRRCAGGVLTPRKWSRCTTSLPCLLSRIRLRKSCPAGFWHPAGCRAGFFFHYQIWQIALPFWQVGCHI